MNDLNQPKPDEAYTTYPHNTGALVTDCILGRLDKIIALLEAQQDATNVYKHDTHPDASEILMTFCWVCMRKTAPEVTNDLTMVCPHCAQAYSRAVLDD